MNITKEDNCMFLFSEQVLLEKVDSIAKKIKLDTGISFVIYKNATFANSLHSMKIDISKLLMNRSNRNACGYCFPSLKKIYINEAIITENSFDRLIKDSYFSVGNMHFNKQSDLLTDVILHELAHIKTGKDHDRRFEMVFEQYKALYYNI